VRARASVTSVIINPFAPANSDFVRIVHPDTTIVPEMALSESGSTSPVANSCRVTPLRCRLGWLQQRVCTERHGDEHDLSLLETGRPLISFNCPGCAPEYPGHRRAQGSARARADPSGLMMLALAQLPRRRAHSALPRRILPASRGPAAPGAEPDLSHAQPPIPFPGRAFHAPIHGGIEAGPNAVLAFAREGHRKRDVNLRDLFDALSYRGFWRFLRKYPSMCWYELRRSLQRLVPEILPDDLATGGSGVRAQAIAPEGDLVQDFRLIARPNALHVLNAPSPAATASLAIGEEIVAMAAQAAG